MNCENSAVEHTWSTLDIHCEDNWTWDKNHHSHEVTLSGKNSRLAHFHPNWSSGTAAVRGTRILNNSRHYWELVLSRRIFGTSMMFGIGTAKARLHEDSFVNLVGIDDNSFGLSHKGLIWHGGQWSYYTKPFRENVSTRVGVFFDGILGTLSYYKDGKPLGVAFKGLNEIKEPLYPIICSTAAKTDMTLENTRRDFVNLQDRCRAVIIKKIKRKKDLKELYLPPKICSYLEEYIDESIEPLKYGNKNIYALEKNFLQTLP